MRLQQPIHLSRLQKEVLAKIVASPTPNMAFEVVSSAESDIDDNFASAVDTLEKMNIVSSNNGTIEIVNQQALQDEGIVDEMGELTELGQELSQRPREENPEDVANVSEPQSNSDSDEDLGSSPEEDFQLESLQLIKTLNDQAKLMEEIRNKF